MLVPMDMKEKSRVRFENNQCIVEGRSFSTEHVVLVKPSHVKIAMDEEGVKMEAEYEGVPRLSAYGNYIVVGVSSDRYIPLWEKLEGSVRGEGEEKGEGKGEIGIRGSMSRGYITVEIIGQDVKPVKFYGKSVELEAESPDFVNVLGSRYQTFYVKTNKDSHTKVTKEGEKLKIVVTVPRQ